MIFAVIDTNVLVSAVLTNNPMSPTSLILNHLLNGDVKPIVNEGIIKEYENVLSRSKFHLPQNKVDFLLEFFRNQGTFTDRTDFEDSLPDEDDRVFYEVSLTVEDSFLVTGNLKHYPHVPKVVTPAEFIRILE